MNVNEDSNNVQGKFFTVASNLAWFHVDKLHAIKLLLLSITKGPKAIGTAI